MVGAFGMAMMSVKQTARVVLGRETAEDYLRRTSWNFVAYDVANRVLPPQARVSVTEAGNLYYLDRAARIAGHEVPPARVLLTEGFTHELLLGSCPLAVVPGRIPLAAGEYPLRASRLRGGVFSEVCYRLSALAADAGSSGP